jgi:hypothetical protein
VCHGLGIQAQYSVVSFVLALCAASDLEPERIVSTSFV